MIFQRLRNLLRISRKVLQDRNDFGQAEVKNLGVTSLRDEDIGRFDIAMNDAFGVRRIEGVSNLNGEGQKEVCL